MKKTAKARMALAVFEEIRRLAVSSSRAPLAAAVGETHVAGASALLFHLVTVAEAIATSQAGPEDTSSSPGGPMSAPTDLPSRLHAEAEIFCEGGNAECDAHAELLVQAANEITRLYADLQEVAIERDDSESARRIESARADKAEKIADAERRYGDARERHLCACIEGVHQVIVSTAAEKAAAHEALRVLGRT